MVVGLLTPASRVPLPRVASATTRSATSTTDRFLQNHKLLPSTILSAMFQRAVKTHAASESFKQNLGKQHTPGSSTPSSQPTNSSQQLNNLSQNNTLRTLPTNVLNAVESRQLSVTNSGVKRTSSGLAKALGMNSQDAFQEQAMRSRPLKSSFGQSKGNNAHGSTQNSVVVYDDDFDSDDDLQVDDPAAKSSISYPKLPVMYPTLQKAHLHTQTPIGSGDAENPKTDSKLLPWSSSPDFHFDNPANFNSIANFAAKTQPLRGSQHGNDSEICHGSPESEQKPRPMKRRALPWLVSQAEERDTTSTHFVTPVKSTDTSTSNPPPTSGSLSSKYMWNAPVSAVKEQQKLLRKTNKKNAQEDEAANDGPIKVHPTKKKDKVKKPLLSKEQRHVLELVANEGKSIFFTGSAGTGKSVLLREIISVLRDKYKRETDRVATTASTGLAACNIGGVTLHSFAGIGLGKEEIPELVKKIKRNQKAKHRWMRTKVLIIDEVSMVDGDLFDKLEAIARQIRNNGRPFGGIQLVITGDFFQLPPVPDYSSRESTFAFDAKSWTTAIDHTIGLHQVFRQRDPTFSGMLNEMREGKLSQDSIKTFRSLSRPLKVNESEGDCEATELFPTRAEVEAANNTRMRQLSGGAMRFEARDGGSVADKIARDKLLANCMAPQELVLKKGAQVMLIKNIDENLVNGSLGKVLGFMNEEMFNSYNADPDLFTGQPNEDAEGDLNPHQKKEKLKFEMLKANTSQCWPVVRFINADGTTRDLLCNREIWKVELPNGEVQASRSQVPLILAWALSIHKAQGQTLEKVKVDLAKVFEKGQAYVALSRATSIDGLQVLRFDPAKVMAHDRVRNFYSGLSRAEGGDKAGLED